MFYVYDSKLDATFVILACLQHESMDYNVTEIKGLIPVMITDIPVCAKNKYPHPVISCYENKP